MGKTKKRILIALIAAWAVLPALCLTALSPVGAHAEAAEADSAQSALNEKLIVKYGMDDTDTANGKTISAYKWDTATQGFVRNASADATIQNSVPNRASGSVSSASGVEGSGALTFTGSAHARASFKLPADAAGMTVSLWVKNVNSYWSSLIEFWNGTSGGRFGKGTMQGNGGRKNESDAWSSNCPAHNSATIAPGGGWDSFVINVNSSDNGGAAVDPMKADTWYQVTFVLTSTEMKAYRNGELKQTFNKEKSATIASSILTAVKSNNGKLGIRLSLDTNDGDILDDLRIYNGALTEEEIQTSYNSLADLVAASPEYYDVEGLGYPSELLLDGAESVSEVSGKMTGVTQRGVSYSYTPLSLSVNDTTPANDEKGIKVSFAQGSVTREATVKFRRTLKLEAESIGYKIGGGASVSVIPQNAGQDIIVKVAKGTDLSAVTAGDTVVKKLDSNSNASNYKTTFLYSASTKTATVRCSYVGYERFDTLYTLKFVEKSTETFGSMCVTGGIRDVELTEAELKGQPAKIAVDDLENFNLTVTLTLAEGATLEGGGNTKTFTQADLQSGKLSFTVVNENGDSNEYFLVPVVRSSDATLKSLSADGYDLSLETGKSEYTVTINTGEGAKLYAALIATANDENATVKKTYDVSANVITITVTAEDGIATRTYTIVLQELDMDASLKGITIGGAPLEDFDPEKTEYTVKYAGEQPAVNATAASPEAEIEKTVESGRVIITVTPKSGTAKTYTITFVKKSSDASLKKLTLCGTEITLENGAASYQAPAGVHMWDIAVVTEVAEGASAAHRVTGNQIVITVTAEDGTTATYTVTVQLQTAAPSEAGTTEDNSPSSGGCSSSLNATAIPAALLVLSAGIFLAFTKNKKRHDTRRDQDAQDK